MLHCSGSGCMLAVCPFLPARCRRRRLKATSRLKAHRCRVVVKKKLKASDKETNSKCSKRTKAEQAAEPTQPSTGKGKAQGKAAKAKPAPQPGRWLDRDCNAALNMQRIGQSRWRPLELCYWKHQGALPVKGKD
ncbi:hypothetical protein QJQ45_019725 [Haematococcus lacustris]|nr:hypothetical protein QJQ45_019725 [Haematococcus lacustris]